MLRYRVVKHDEYSRPTCHKYDVIDKGGAGICTPRANRYNVYGPVGDAQARQIPEDKIDEYSETESDAWRKFLDRQANEVTHARHKLELLERQCQIASQALYGTDSPPPDDLCVGDGLLVLPSMGYLGEEA